MKTPIVLTHCGKLGDFLYCLPIASWIWKTTGRPTHWVLPHTFAPFNHIDRLLAALPFTSQATYVNHAIHFAHGGQPYRFNPNDYGVPVGQYFNLGFRGYPDKFVTAYCAEEHGFGWDREFTLEFGDVVPSGKAIRTEQPEVAEAAPHAETFPVPMDLLELGKLFKAANERHTWYSGPAAMLYLARLPFFLHYETGHPSRRLYLPEDAFGGALITPVLYTRKPKS